MEYEAWEPIYERIVADFGYDPAADRQARDLLAQFVMPFDFADLDFADRTVAIAGGSRTLEAEISLVREAERVIAVSNAAAVLEAAGIRPDLVVTDLDGTPETAISLATDGVPVAIHAHGDNVAALRTYLPRFELETVIGTTQVEPLKSVFNFGGFTDGDRAAFLADHFGGRSLSFPGWEFGDESVSGTKRRKLKWAARLLRCLERRRNERFAVLDGWRVEIAAFPDDDVWDCTN
ncbi:MAG: 6-hydroxymethylpterin diphosphokinase MptE-like protein [Halodesulfurarchaeum sp.]|nr:6-hydroxymethylpterin diphosphokinase MptE-like protein [Halodesulfurarchaeum sp.]